MIHECGKAVCFFCDGQTLEYWDEMRDHWNRQLNEFRVDWRPDIVF